jgi:hypothetical protein
MIGKLFVQTIFTGAVKIGKVSGDLTVKALRCLLKNFVKNLHIQVNDAAAIFADEVIVGGGICIEVVDTVSYSQSGDLAQVSQKRQVPVYGTEADGWILETHIGVYHIGGRVIFSS